MAYITLEKVVADYLRSNICKRKNKGCIRRMKRMDSCLWFTYMGERRRRGSHYVQHRIRYRKPFLIPIWNQDGEPKEYFTAFANKL